ncbi:MAG TPA: FCD domain-containing protein [Streptosporangiaceae bacterium]
MAITLAESRGDLLARAGASAQSKRAARVADRMVEDVIAAGWPVGQILGSETGLLDRYRVSRAVFREAVRLVEHQQVARMRRGPGGGLVVTEPTVDAVIDAVVLYLYRVEATLDEVFEARIVLEEIACELAAPRLDADGRARLGMFAADAAAQLRPDPRALHSVVASLSRNPAVSLFVDVLNRVSLMYSTGWQNSGPAVAADTARAHARIAEALIAGDVTTARRRMHKHLQAEADYLGNLRSTRQLLPDSAAVPSQAGRGKRAEAVARHLTQVVIADGLRPGELIGSEPELIEREGVSRAVLREAVRLLEHHQVARMRRGPGGGLFVFEPNAVAVADVAAICLVRKGMRLADLAELRTPVEIEIAGLAAERITGPGVARLREALDREAKSPEEEQADVSYDLHAAVAAAAGSRVLELIAQVFIRFSRIYQIERLAASARNEISAEVRRSHEGIAAAIGRGGRDLARNRMRRHLDALGTLMR